MPPCGAGNVAETWAREATAHWHQKASIALQIGAVLPHRALSVATSRSGCSKLARSRRAPQRVLVRSSILQAQLAGSARVLLVCQHRRGCMLHNDALLPSRSSAHLNRLAPLSFEEHVPTRMGWISSRAAAVAGSMAMCASPAPSWRTARLAPASTRPRPLSPSSRYLGAVCHKNPGFNGGQGPHAEGSTRTSSSGCRERDTGARSASVYMPSCHYPARPAKS